MSTKAKKPSAKAAPAPKASKKSTKAALDTEVELSAAPANPEADEEAEEAEEASAASSASSGGNAAALAAATGTGEMSASFKNFRHHPDMENFYRFIYENDLRLEALAIIDEMMMQKLTRKTVKMAKTNAH